ncbi:MAG TPA: FG-GAP repeat protein [Thermoanaerobaculia bacterium]|nr:FG-GAP repeat protein [Thermoanaerobaculia bacterium]
MRTWGFIGLFLSLLFVRQGAAVDFVQQARLTASDAAAGDGFGGEVALSADGTIALISAAGADCGAGLDCGAAYVFVRTEAGWHQQVKLTASDPTPGSQFGFGLALSGDGSTALVRARSTDCLDSPDCAVVHVFRRIAGSWSQQARLRTSGGFWSHGLGLMALAGDGRTALVGSPLSCEGSNCGIVHVFVREGESWSEEARLKGSATFFFGNSVALSKDGLMALAGALEGLDPTTAVFSYVKRGGVWTREQELTTGFQNQSESQFGAVSLSGDGGTALLSTPEDGCTHDLENPDENSFCGSVRVFSRAGGAWTPRQVLKVTRSQGSSFLGGRTAISGSGALALVLGVRSAFFLRGAGTWILGQQVAGDTSASVSEDGHTVLTGCACGVVYVYTLAPALAEVPALGGPGLILLALLLAATGAVALRRRLAA